MTDNQNEQALDQANKHLVLLTASIAGLQNSIAEAIEYVRMAIERELRQITTDLPTLTTVKGIVSSVTRIPSSCALGSLVELGMSLEQQQAEATALQKEIALRTALRGRMGESA